MNFREASKEIGKGFINIGVAFVIFALIQPLVNDKISIKLFVVAVIGATVFMIIGGALVGIGGDKK